ncbi:MAG: DALR domain-containing protein, partial [Candidatus Hydrothermarchaeota archaeon]
ERAFFKDIKTLNLESADFYPRATEHVQDIVVLVKRLLEKGMAYRLDGDVYFDLSRVRGYGTLARLRRKPQGRVSKDDYERREAGDFILWKAHRRQDGDVYWETELGKGRPGWSIQCSAMAMRYLGPTIDIHTGGIDNIFSHNENEIAQSEGATGKRFVRYWLHARHLYVDGRKMSKSLGNYHTLSSLMEMGYDPRAVRYLLLSVHYRRRLDFTLAKMERAQRDLEHLLGCMELLGKVKGGRDDPQVGSWIREAKARFRTAMDDDLDTPGALQALTELAARARRAAVDGRLSRGDARKVLRTLLDFDLVLGFLKTQNIYKFRR